MTRQVDPLVRFRKELVNAQQTLLAESKMLRAEGRAKQEAGDHHEAMLAYAEASGLLEGCIAINRARERALKGK